MIEAREYRVRRGTYGKTAVSVHQTDLGVIVLAVLEDRMDQLPMRRKTCKNTQISIGSLFDTALSGRHLPEPPATKFNCAGATRRSIS